MYKYRSLDFEPATHKLQELMFDVKAVPLVTKGDEFFNSDFDGIPVKNYLALVNADNKEVLSVVSDQYELFTNKQAYEFGKEAFVQLFPSVKKEDLVPYKVIATSRKTSCHIDLIHINVNFDVWEQETWFPFIRITNSYNRTHKFTLELGFVRKLCSNGVIFDKKTITVKYSHTKGSIPVSIKSDVSKLRALENEFKSSLLNLKRFHVPRSFAFPLVCKAFQLPWKLDKDSLNYFNEQVAVEKLRKGTKTLSDVYMQSGGENAFAVMNVMTDLVSHQDQYGNLPHYTLRANQYYHRISDWMREFCDAAEKRDFKMETYLGDYLKFGEN